MGWSYGKHTRSDTGLGFTRGRGAAKLSFEVSFREIEEWAKRNGQQMPKLNKMAAGSAANVLLKQLRKAMDMGGGMYGVSKFAPYDPFTVELRRLRSYTGKMGGILAESWTMTRWLDGGVQYVGWPDKKYRKKGDLKTVKGSLGDLAEAFQDGRGGPECDEMFTDPKNRQYWHKQGITDVPRSYTHTKRDVLNSFEKHIQQNLAKWKKETFQRAIAKQLAQDRGWAVYKEKKAV